MPTESCGTCRFFRALDSLCLRYPPHVYPIRDRLQGIGPLTILPVVTSSHWCGEWTPAPSSGTSASESEK